MSDRPSRHVKGIWIPLFIWEHTDLSPIEKIILAEIDSLDGGKGCWASNEYLASFLSISANHVNNCLTKLRKLGLVETISFDGRRRYIRAKTAYLKKGKLPTEKKVRDKNTTYSLIDDKERSLKPSLCHRQKSASRRCEGFGILPTTKKTFTMKMANKLYKLLKRHKVRFYRIPDLTKWAAEFTKLLHSADPPSKSEIRDALDWYDENYGKKYCPKKHEASTFCRNFHQIESAMERQEMDLNDSDGNEDDLEDSIYDPSQWQNPEDDEA